MPTGVDVFIVVVFENLLNFLFQLIHSVVSNCGRIDSEFS